MGRSDLEDYFWHINYDKFGPLVIEGKPTGSDNYKLVVTDSRGIELVDTQKHTIDNFRKEAELLANALRVKGYEVRVSHG